MKNNSSNTSLTVDSPKATTSSSIEMNNHNLSTTKMSKITLLIANISSKDCIEMSGKRKDSIENLMRKVAIKKQRKRRRKKRKNKKKEKLNRKSLKIKNSSTSDNLKGMAKNRKYSRTSEFKTTSKIK